MKNVKEIKAMLSWDTIHENDYAEAILPIVKENIDQFNDEELSKFLELSSDNSFMVKALESYSSHEWSDIIFDAIRKANYTLLDLFEYRCKQHPNKIMFNDKSSQPSSSWTYAVMQRNIKAIASAFYKLKEAPKVAIICENSVDSAASDLACLFYDILDTPLSVHFSKEVYSEIFEELDINIAICDTETRCKMLAEIRNNENEDLQILCVNDNFDYDKYSAVFLGEYIKQLNLDDIEAVLEARPRMKLNEVATLMFTSGSSGKPKGVAFSIYNLISKRYARAAALPLVGPDEVLLCYLPLFHTFGRYFEMLGAIYWSGTYVFTGNPSKETLINLFPEVNPTGFISIPLRWFQLYEEIQEKAINQNFEMAKEAVLGKKLKWGISAAGYLDPKVFKFFHAAGVELTSGFGMTEATGGITMTPPKEYRTGSTGKLLPGLKYKLSDVGELLISGHYIGRYLEEARPKELIKYPEEEDYYLATGDIFEVDEDGYFSIIDRVKDIYKNIKGQTIAPKTIENKFEDVPGIKRTFLVGDGRDYNVLLIIPDTDDPVFVHLEDKEQVREYYNRIILQANKELAPYERVVNFELLKRDFDIDKKEITPKGTFNRKIVEKSFKREVEELYINESISLKIGDLNIKIPRWFYRDLAILESDIIPVKDGLFNVRSNEILTIKKSENDYFRVGDLEYKINSDTIDLGLFARQPNLWLGNPSLYEFSPCKDGLDVKYKSISNEILLSRETKYSKDYKARKQSSIRQKVLIEIHQLLSDLFFADKEKALFQLKEISNKLPYADNRINNLIRNRLQLLAFHEEEDIRCSVYMILLLDEPSKDYSEVFPTFLRSGKSFLNASSISQLAKSNIGQRRLDALRKRMASYREKLTWPGDADTRHQFEYIFVMLRKFAENFPEYYSTIRAELASWILLENDTLLAATASREFELLHTSYEEKLKQNLRNYHPEIWSHRLVYDDSISMEEVKRINEILIGTYFLEQSIILAYDENDFDLVNVMKNGIWISPLRSYRNESLYRININTINGKRYDLQLILQENLYDQSVLNIVYWLVAMSDYPNSGQILPRTACVRPELQARSMIYPNTLSAWDKIAEIALSSSWDYIEETSELLKKIYVESISVYFKLWFNSGKRILPGYISPENVSLPEKDYQEQSLLLSLSGMHSFESYSAFISVIIKNYYEKAIAHYPWLEEQISLRWIFIACIEALGKSETLEFINSLEEESSLVEEDLFEKYSLHELIEKIKEEIKICFHIPLSVDKAIGKYKTWQRLNPNTSKNAKEATINEIYSLYKLSEYQEYVRYYLWRYTYFADSEENIQEVYDKLLNKLASDLDVPAIQCIELSELQAVINDELDSKIFSRIVFPRKSASHVMKLEKNSKKKDKVSITSTINDKLGEHYTLRPARTASEIGKLYSLYYSEKYMKNISEEDRFMVAVDNHDILVGGLCFRFEDESTVLIDALAISTPLKNRGIARAIIDDFCVRMEAIGINLVKTRFYLTEFSSRLGFKLDKRLGIMIREL